MINKSFEVSGRRTFFMLSSHYICTSLEKVIKIHVSAHRIVMNVDDIIALQQLDRLKVKGKGELYAIALPITNKQSKIAILSTVNILTLINISCCF